MSPAAVREAFTGATAMNIARMAAKMLSGARRRRCQAAALASVLHAASAYANAEAGEKPVAERLVVRRP